MEAGWPTIFLCALFMFSVEGASFTKQPQNSLLTVEGDNVTLEWRYTLDEGESLRMVLFENDTEEIVEKIPSDNLPWIDSSYQGRLYASVTNERASFVFLGVKRSDAGGYTLKVNTRKSRLRGEVEISVLYIPEITAHPQNVTEKEGDNATFNCNAMGNPVPQISWNKGGSPLGNSSSISLSADNKDLTIKNVNRVDSGEYRCVATNSLGNDTSNPAYLGVQYKPEIRTVPRLIQRTEGDEVTLLCNAIGNPAPTVSWTKNGFPLDNSNSSRMNFSKKGKQLTIKNVSKIDGGVYLCAAENSLGNATSHDTTLEVHYPPEVTMIGGPQQFAVVGKTKKLVCKYNALPPVSEAQWIKDGIVISRNASLLTRNESRLTVSYYSESQLQLLINQSTSQDAGNYTCLVINAVGNSSLKTSVISQELPSITIYPRRETVLEGKKVTLSCNATGNPGPSISWVKDGFSVNNNSRISFSPDNERLTITNVSRTDSGEYRCVAKNRVGNDTANSKVGVLFEPEVSIDGNQKQYLAKGGNIRLICRYEASPPVSEVQWIKEGTVIARNALKLMNGSRVTIPSFNESQIQLSITAASLRDGGNYTCNATNILSSTQDTMMIIIEDKPEIATHPRNITTEEGHGVTLYCNATGNPAPTISWTKNGNLLSNGSRIILSPSQEQLTITKVNRIDSGKYKCRAKNRVGRDTSYASTVNVQYQTKIVSHPQAIVTEEEGNNLTLFCNATANPPANISWTKDGSLINNNSRINFSDDNKRLNIRNVNRKDKGSYRCVANNSLGSDTSNVSTVDIQYRPVIVIQPQNVTEPEGKNVTLTCNATGNPEPELSWFSDEHLVKSGNRISLSAGNQSLIIANMNRTDSGEYLCVAHNKVGNASSKVAILNVQYRPEIITDPSDDSVKEGKSTTFYCNATGNPLPEISWEKNGNPIGNNSKISYSAESKELKIINVKRTDRGTYRCVAVNRIGNATSRNATLVVKYRPEIVTEPQNVTKTEGNNVTLTCNATGNPEPKLSWFNDEHPVKSNNRISLSAGNQSLMIANVNRTDSGKYLCVAHNEVGNASSKVAILNVQHQPEITTDPSDDVVKEGKNTTLYCNATGNPLPEISWEKNGNPIGNNSRISSSAESKELKIINVYRTDSGTYRCMAVNRIGNATSRNATLVVKYRSEIVTEPQNVTETEGKTVTLTCNATGNPEPELSWFNDEHPVKSNNRISLSAGNQSLMIANVNRTDSGKYLCVAHNEVGNASSKVAVLNVQYQPEIITDPSDNVVKEGKNTTLYCNATGNPLPEISWEKNGNPIGNSSKTSHSELKIMNVYRTDSGKYRCVALNGIGSAISRNATLFVEYQSKITTHPSNETKREGENVTLHCNATGYPPPALSWTKDGSDISNSSRISFSADEEQLAITNTSRVDSGVYRCVASNRLGNDTSGAAFVDVQFAPGISIPPRNVTVVKGEHVTFTCSVVGNPTPSVIWTKNGEDLNVTANSRLKLSSRNRNRSLEIAEVDLSDSGQYICVANNSQGKLSSSAATLTVQYVPDPPKDVEVISRGSREVNISWTAGFDGNSAIQNYTVKISEDEQTFKDAICQGTLIDSACVIYSTRVSIKKLFPWTKYYLKVFARNVIGASSHSSVVNVTTNEEVPSSAPAFKVTALNSTAVKVSWQMLSNQDARGIIMGYYILYKRKIEPEASWRNRTVNKANTTSLVLASLDEYTSYQFAIQAFNSKGISNRSEIEETKTDEDVPRAAPAFKVTVLSSTAVNVSWQILTKQDARGVILGYYVLYRRVSDPQVDWENRTVNRGETTSLLVAYLEKYASYQFAIQAFNGKGVSDWSEIEERKTDQDVPSAAPELNTAEPKNSTSIELTWEPVPKSNLNGILTKYVIRFSIVDDEKKIKKKVENYASKVVINGLRASTSYSFQISAATVKGEGPWSKPKKAKTKDPPVPPTPSDIGTTEVTVAFVPRQILSSGTEVSYYQIMVVPLRKGEEPGKSSDEVYVKVTRKYEDRVEGEPYITAEFSNNNERRTTFPVGDGEYYSRKGHIEARRKHRAEFTKYLNGKLDDDTEYAVFQRSLSSPNDYQNEGFTQFKTRKPIPPVLEPEDKTVIVVGVFIGLFIVCVVVVGGIVIVWLRGRQRTNENEVDEDIPMEDRGYENFVPEGEISVEDFEDHVKHLNDDDLFSVEYGAIHPRGNFTSKATLSEENKHKNRYNNIVAYDHSRVKLNPIKGVPGSDYINANFLNGYQKEKAYIATQGPLEHTTDDFWRMVWEQGTKTIVMVTNLEEKGRLKCHQYWPSEGAESYGEIKVTLVQTVELSEFTIRTMTLNHANNTEQRTVNQYHYTVWPDHGVPECPSSLLTFVRKASGANPPDAGPMVVHCSAGVGRTGTFIVVDAMLRRIAAEKTVDVYEYVTSLRQDRNLMVQVEEQYILIHDVLVEAIHSGFTEIHANDLRSHIKNLMQVNQTSGQSEMDEEFIRLGRCFSASQFTTQAANMACNVTKNRYPNAFPYDETRVKLSVISGVEGSDYINANFIDGYMARRAFIATQAPIPDTIPDFWRMIWEQESSTIVMLSKETEGGKVKVHHYWPAEKPTHIGTLVVEKTSEMTYEDYTMREMKLTHTKESASRVVRQYHYTGWPDSGSPESGTGLIDLIGQVQRWQQQSGNTKITVHCSAGVGRTGVFCALSILIGQLKSEGGVDVFQTVKQLRAQRPAMVQTKDQYEFIYSALSEYLDSFDAYSNF